MAEMIWVENSYYNRVREEARQAERRKLEADRKRQAEQERLRRLRREAAQAAAEDVQQRQQRLQEETDRLLQGVDRVSHRLRTEVEQYVAQNRQEMDGLRSAVRTVEQQAVQLDGKIDRLERTVEERFRALADAIAEERTRAQLYVNRYGGLVEQISALHPRQLIPGVLETRLMPTENYLAMNMENGDYQAAIGLAQSGLPEAEECLQQLQQRNEHFCRLCQEGASLLTELGQQMRQLDEKEPNRYILPLGENQYEYDGDITYWTSGLYSVAVQNFETVQQHYTRAREDIDPEAMEQVLRHLEQVTLQLEECRQVAREEFRLFAMTQNLVSAIHNALTGDGAWMLTESGFAGDDSRRSYRLCYSDGAGCTASVVVLPNREVSPGGEPGEVQFVVGVHEESPEPNPFRCQLLRESLLARLWQENISLGQHNQAPRYGTGWDRVSFEEEATRQGDGVKENRLAAVRRQLELTDR